MPAELSRILSLLSHELRAPLGVVRGYMRLLQQTSPGLDERQQKLLADALRVSERAAALLDEASDLARLARGETALELRDAPLKPLLEAALPAVVLPEDTPVTVTMDGGPDVSVRVDPAHVRRAIAGLVSAVGRAQANEAVIRLSWRVEGTGVTVDIAPHEPDAAEVSIESLRRTSGLGLAVPLAETALAALGGGLSELDVDGRTRGVQVTLPIAGSGV